MNPIGRTGFPLNRAASRTHLVASHHTRWEREERLSADLPRRQKLRNLRENPFLPLPGRLCVLADLTSRRILHVHVNATDHPTTEWTRQQFREFVNGQSGHRYVVHDRDTIFSAKVDEALSEFGLKVLKTPARSPMANAHCERVIGTIRRECLDYLIPMNERHLKRIVREFATYYNRGRPHTALGPGLPEPNQAAVPASGHQYQLPSGYRITKTPVLGGLHYDYRLEKEVA